MSTPVDTQLPAAALVEAPEIVKDCVKILIAMRINEDFAGLKAGPEIERVMRRRAEVMWSNLQRAVLPWALPELCVDFDQPGQPSLRWRPWRP